MCARRTRNRKCKVSSSKVIESVVPEQIYVTAKVASSARKFHLTATCQHLKHATHPICMVSKCKTCEKVALQVST
jgi:hypothetical protein